MTVPPESEFPAAYCLRCEQWLTPSGSRLVAEKTARTHEDGREKMEGIEHTTVVYDKPSTAYF